MDGALVVRVPARRATLQLVAARGRRWPDEPLELAAPEPPELAWWEV